MSEQTHTCAATGCSIGIPSAMLFCRKHWNLTPRALQDRIYQTWNALRAGGSLPDYNAARSEAVVEVARREKLLADQERRRT
jgi:hypothetical protein